MDEQHSNLTGQPASERPLPVGEARFRAVVDGFSDPIMIVDRYELIRYVNVACLRAFGYKLADIISKPFDLIVPSEDRAIATETLAYHQEAVDRPRQAEHRLIRADGILEIVETSANTLNDPSGERITILHMRVITERKRIAEMLRANEERYRQLIENSHDLIQSVGPDGRILYVNHAWLKTLEYRAADLLNLSVWDIIHPDSLLECQRHFTALRQGQDVAVIHLTLRTQYGRAVDVEGTTIVQMDEGRLIATSSFFRDVTEERRNARVQAARFAFTRILAESPAVDTALSQVLEAIAANLGWQVAELWLPDEPGQQLRRCYGWHIIGHPEIDTFATASYDFRFAPGEGLPGRASATGTVIWEQDLAVSPSFRRVSLIAAAGLRSAVAVPIMRDHKALGVMLFFSRTSRPVEASLEVVLTDLGGQLGQFIARKEAEHALEVERAQLAQRVEERTTDLARVNADLARAVRAKDEFLANMSHELRTPLNTILTLSEILLEQLRGPLNERQLDSLHTIESSGQHLLTLINDILDLSKVEAGRLDLRIEPVVVSDVCQMSLMFVKELALKKQLQLNFQLNDEQAIMDADPKRLKQMLVNLLSNAVKFTPAGGTVGMEVVVRPEDSQINFIVRDTGIGISREDHARLFQPFTQVESHLHRHHEGTGLGLALVRRLADLHGGHVCLESELGQGSCFTITLPYQAAPKLEELASRVGTVGAADLLGQVLRAEPTQPAAGSGRVQILLADDNESNIEVIGDYLQGQGYLVVVAQDGYEAIEQASRVQPDLILLDVQMPKINGLEVTRRLRADPRFTATPIIAVTALAMAGDRERCLAAGANEYLTKPLSLKQLVTLIQLLLPKA